MALKRVVASLDEVPEAYRAEYAKASDGSFVLSLDGVEDVGGLKSALQKERDAREKYEKEIKDLRKQFEGLDPEKGREALRRIQELEEKQLLDAGKVEELFAQRTERMKADWSAKEARYQEEIKSASEAHSKSETRLSELLIDGTLRDAAGKRRAKAALTPLLIRGARHGDIDGIRWELRDGQPVPVKGDAIYPGKDPSKPMSAEEYLDLVAQKMPDLFEASTGGGASNAGRSQMGTFTLTREQARDTSLYRRTAEAAAKAGQQVQIVAE